MTTALDSAFIARAQSETITMLYGDHQVVFAPTLAVRHVGGATSRAELEVRVGNTVHGYITPWSDNEHGAVAAHLFDFGMPRLFTTVDEALVEIFNT